MGLTRADAEGDGGGEVLRSGLALGHGGELRVAVRARFS